MAEPSRDELPVDNLLDEQSRLWQHGQGPLVEEFLLRQPGLRQHRVVLIDLIYHEALLRQRLGERLDPQEYLRRFPELADDIRRQFAMHDVLATPPVPARTIPHAPPTASSSAPCVPLADLLLWLARPGLLEPPQAQQCRQEFCGGALTAHEVGRELLRRGWLTPLQVNRLLQGKGRSLFVGPYVLHSKLGSGGMGQVFKARHSRLGRVVAVKVLHDGHLASPEAIRRFQREVRAASRLSHTHIVHALDADADDGRPYLVLEYVEGTELGRLVKEHGPVPAAQACEYIRQAALALQHAHDKGMVHRDVKPSNLLLSSQGLVKLLDLGLARYEKAAGEPTTSELTDSGVVMGTPDYIAPEQIRDARTADIRADLYSLGCTLFHLLAGRPPFAGSTVGHKLAQHQTEDAPPLESLRSDVPVALVGVVRKLMAKQPVDRYQTPAELIAELEQIMVRGRWRPATPFSSLSEEETAVIDSSWRIWDRHNRPRWWLAGAVAGLLCLGIVFLLWLALRPRPVSPPAPVQRPPVTKLADLRYEDIPALERFTWQPKGLVQVLGTHHGGRSWWYVKALAVSPDGKYVATGGQQRLVQVWDTQTLRLVHSLEVPGHVSGLGFTDQGRAVLISYYSFEENVRLICRWPLDGSRPWKVLHKGMDFAATRFSPDGTRALWSDEKSSGLFDIKTGEPLRRIQWPEDPTSCGYFGAAFSPDGKQALLPGEQRGDIVRLDAATGDRLQTYKVHETWVTALAFLPDGRGFLSGGLGEGVKCFRVGNKPADAQPPAKNSVIADIAVSADGKCAIWSDLSADNITLADLELEGKFQPLHFASGRYHRLAFLPGSRRAVSCTTLKSQSSDKIDLWDTQTRKNLIPGKEPIPDLRSVAFSLRNNQVVACGAAGWLRTWNVLSGKASPLLPVGNAELSSVSVSPDGRRVACIDVTGKVVLRDSVPGDEDDWTFDTELNPAKAVAFAPDGERIFTGGGHGAVKDIHKAPAVRAFDLQGKERCRFDGHTAKVMALALSGDGNWLLTGSQPDHDKLVDEFPVRLWDARTGKELLRCRPGGNDRQDFLVYCVAIAADGSWGVSGCHRGLVNVYDFNLQQKVARPTRPLGHSPRDNSPVFGVVVTPDNRIVSAGYDGRIVVWKREGGRPEGEWQLPGPIIALALAPDGKHVATANGNGTVYILRLPAPRPRKRP
jgi:serine/threonine-protein kinase